MEMRQKFSTFVLDFIHLRIRCKILLSVWGPSGALPSPTPLSCCNPTRPHAVSGQLINSWVGLKQSMRSEGNAFLLWLLNYGIICPGTLYSPLHCLFFNHISKPTRLQDLSTQCSGSLKCLLGGFVPGWGSFSKVLLVLMVGICHLFLSVISIAV